MEGSCPGENYSGAVVWGIKVPGGIVLGDFHGGKLFGW